MQKFRVAGSLDRSCSKMLMPVLALASLAGPEPFRVLVKSEAKAPLLRANLPSKAEQRNTGFAC